MYTIDLYKKFHFACFHQLTLDILIYSNLLKSIVKYWSINSLQFILKLRTKTVEGMKYTMENPLIILRKYGVVKLSHSYEIRFDENNKKKILAVIFFHCQMVFDLVTVNSNRDLTQLKKYSKLIKELNLVLIRLDCWMEPFSMNHIFVDLI